MGCWEPTLRCFILVQDRLSVLISFKMSQGAVLYVQCFLVMITRARLQDSSTYRTVSAAVDQALSIGFVKYCTNVGHASTESKLATAPVEDVVCECSALCVEYHIDVLRSRVGSAIEGLQEGSLEQAAVGGLEGEIPLARDGHGDRHDLYLLFVARVCSKCAFRSVKHEDQELIERLLKAMEERQAADFSLLVPQSVEDGELFPNLLGLSATDIGYEFGRRLFSVSLFGIAYVLDRPVVVHKNAS